MTAAGVQDSVLIAAALCAFLVLAGFVTLESGLVRAKHSVNAAAKALVHAGLIALVTWAFGHALMSRVGLPDPAAVMPGAAAASPQLFLNMALAASAVAILSGAVAERMTLRAYAVMTLLFGAVIFPVGAQWVWAEGDGAAGLLKGLGFIDLAGAGAIHMTAGAAAVTAALVLGPRTGRFTGAKRATIIQSQSFPFVALGVFLLWLGWFGLAIGQAALAGVGAPAVVLTLLVAGAAGVTAAFVASQIAPREVSVVHLAHGALAGVIAVAAGAHIIEPSLAVLVGALAAGAAILGARLLARLQVDDALGMSSVHLFAGLVGVLAAGLVGPSAGPGAVAVQTLGVLVLLIWTAGVMGAGLMLAKNTMGIRVTADDERVGLNVSEHGMTTDVAVLVGQMGAMNQHGGAFSYLDADDGGEIGQVAQEYNRAVDLFRAQIGGLRDEIAEASDTIMEANSANARLSAEITARDIRLEETTREVTALTEQLSRSLVLVETMEFRREGLVKLLVRAFKEPIRRIHTMAKKAGESRDPIDVEGLIEAAREESARLARRLADVIDYAQVSALNALPEAETTPIGRLFEELTLFYRPRAESRSVKLRMTWDEEVPRLNAHMPALRKIVTQVIDNALENTGPRGAIAFSARSSGAAELTIEVVDTGRGISPGMLAGALDPFTDRPHAEGEAPTGVGFALVKKLVEMQSGTLAIQSRPGVGTQVKIVLPLGAAARAPRAA